MKFLADENFPRVALLLLRQSGFDVAAIAEIHPGIPDSEVLALASTEGRTLLALDKDFGELAFRRGLPASGRLGRSLLRSQPPPDSYDPPAASSIQVSERFIGRNAAKFLPGLAAQP